MYYVGGPQYYLPPGSVIHLENSHDSVYGVLMSVIYDNTIKQSKINKGKSHTWCCLEKNQAQASKNPFLVESLKTCLFPPVMSMTKHMKCCIPRKLIRESVLIFLLGPGHIGPTAQHIPKFQTLRRKAAVWYEPHCSYSFGTVSHSYHFWDWWKPFQNPSSYILAKGQPCKQVFVRRAVPIQLC